MADSVEILHLALLLFAIVVLHEVLSGTDYPFVIGAVALALIGIMVLACYRQIVRHSAMVWSALVWFRLGVALFIGFGSAVPAFVDDRTLQYLQGLYSYTDRETLKFLAMSILSTIIVLSIARFFYVRIPRPSDKHKQFSSQQMLLIATGFLLLGGLARYGVLLPNWMGQTDVVITGWLASLAKAYSAGLFLLLLWTLRHSRRLMFIPVILVTIDAIVGILIWDKSELVFTLAFAYLAVIYHNFSARRAAIGLIAIIGVIYVMQPIALYGRSQSALSDDNSFSHRVAIITDYLSSDSALASRTDGELSSLLRFSYVAPATFFMNRYDKGMPGNAHDNALAALVPGVIWPDKPNVGEAGSQAYGIIRKVSDPDTSLGITHFAEAYWSFGWLGALLVFVPGGLILSFVAVRGVQLILAERWFQLPIVLMSLNMGYKVSGSWVPTIVGGFAVYAVLSLIFALAEQILFRATATRTHTNRQRRN